MPVSGAYHPNHSPTTQTGRGKFCLPNHPPKPHLSLGILQELGQFQPLELPLFLAAVPAGFPSPADDYVQERLDLNAYLIHHPHATFLTKVEGHSMTGAGIHSGDLLIVDRAVEATSGRVVVAAIDGELTVKRLIKHRGQVSLQAEHPNYPPLLIQEHTDCTIWGVVIYAIHHVR